MREPAASSGAGATAGLARDTDRWRNPTHRAHAESTGGLLLGAMHKRRAINDYYVTQTTLWADGDISDDWYYSSIAEYFHSRRLVKILKLD